MKIVSKLHFNTIFVATTVLIIGLVVMFMLQSAKAALSRHRITIQFETGAFELNILTSEYLLHHSERAKNQWYLKHADIEAHILKLGTNGAKEDVLVRQIGRILQNIDNVFEKVVASHETALAEGIPETRHQIEQNLANNLLSQLQQLTLLTGQTDEINQRALMRALRHGTFAAFSLIVVLGATVIATSQLLSKSIATPLERLREGTQIVGEGKLDHRLGIDRKDELGELSRAFDRMAESLKQTTVSRDRLVAEIDERKKAQDKLRRTLEELEQSNRELERSNRELEQFAYVASHDLQEPLRMISSYTQLLARQYRGKLDADADEFIGYAVDGANRMKSIINDLLGYSRVGSQGKPFEPTDTGVVLKQALINLNPAVQESGAKIESGDMPTVMADEGQMCQLFQNLVANAIKYRGEQPVEIKIEAEQIKDSWQFSVCDNGIGIAPKYFEKIFVIFQRLHGNDKFQGTGIGLAVCKRIVERHGGRIWLVSEPGKGTTFFFTIPSCSN